MRGDLGLIVKQHSVTGFDVKLTPMGNWEWGMGNGELFLLTTDNS
ncbi:MAG: hypothetical protein U7126_01300 [Microcoleus sp.]